MKGPGPRTLVFLGLVAAGACWENPEPPTAPDASGDGDLPVAGVLQRFGVWNPAWPGYHLAVDLAGAGGTPVSAVADGTVRVAETGVSGYGAVMVVEHRVGGVEVLAVYGHLSTREGLGAREGDEVRAGGRLGSLAYDDEDGGAWRPHLHFGLRRGPHREGPHLCGVWLYVGYSRECPGTTHEEFTGAGWLDPLDYLPGLVPPVSGTGGPAGPGS